jgi:hypothetical protein
MSFEKRGLKVINPAIKNARKKSDFMKSCDISLGLGHYQDIINVDPRRK